MKTSAWFWILLLFSTIQTGYSQQSPFFSHYLFSQEQNNPSALAKNKDAYINAIHRTQWLGYSASFDQYNGAPNTQYVSLGVPVRSKYISYFGAQVVRDALGAEEVIEIKSSLVYTKSLPTADIHFGIMPSLILKSFHFSRLRFVDENDPLNLGVDESQLRPSMHIGATYVSDKNYSIGAAYNYLVKPAFDFTDSIENNLTSLFIGNGSYTIKTSKDTKIENAVQVRTDFLTYTLDISSILYYKNLLWGGLSFRRSEAVIGLFGYSFGKNLRFKAGYSIDWVINETKAKQLTSHEIFFSYSLPDLVFGAKKPVKSPRFVY